MPVECCAFWPTSIIGQAAILMVKMCNFSDICAFSENLAVCFYFYCPVNCIVSEMLPLHYLYCTFGWYLLYLFSPRNLYFVPYLIYLLSWTSSLTVSISHSSVPSLKIHSTGNILQLRAISLSIEYIHIFFSYCFLSNRIISNYSLQNIPVSQFCPLTSFQ